MAGERGPAKEVFFAQEHVPGRLCASDFTHMTELGVTIGGEPFEHMVYHFVLTYSNWEDVTHLLLGELREPQRRVAERGVGAGRRAGRAPHRPDEPGGEQASGSEEFTRRYEAVMAHYGVRPQEIKRARARERRRRAEPHRFKRGGGAGVAAARQPRLSEPGSVRGVPAGCVRARNARRKERCRRREEHAAGACRPGGWSRSKRERVRVQSGSMISVERNVYSVPAA